MLKARAATLIPRLALGIVVVLLASAGPARADRGFGFHHSAGFHNHFFFRNGFFFRDRFFFGFNGFGFPAAYPWPAVGYYPPAYYAPPAYYPTAADGPAPQAGTRANCREFRQTITLDGHPHKAIGTACQQPDGSWRIAP